MENISLSGEDLSLKRSKSYFVIDALFISNIKEKLLQLNRSNLERDIREKVFAFPMTDTPFTSLTFDSNSIDENITFRVSNIKKAEESDEKELCFAIDSGLIVFVETDIFPDFTEEFDYEKLVDSPIETINRKYWAFLSNTFDKSRIALIVAPGIDSGFEFVGSGIYKIAGGVRPLTM